MFRRARLEHGAKGKDSSETRHQNPLSRNPRTSTPPRFAPGIRDPASNTPTEPLDTVLSYYTKARTLI
jgi:hypothetical protein